MSWKYAQTGERWQSAIFPRADRASHVTFCIDNNITNLELQIRTQYSTFVRFKHLESPDNETNQRQPGQIYNQRFHYYFSSDLTLEINRTEFRGFFPPPFQALGKIVLRSG